MGNTYRFEELIPNIVGSYLVDDYFSFVIYAHASPDERDIILIDHKPYEVSSVTDCTDNEEFEQGLSYSKVYLTQI
jgi:hypothetical protein